MPKRSPQPMQSIIALLRLASLTVAIVLSCSQFLLAEAAFPYTATVSGEAAIHSGPGDQFYETDRLGAGSEVEVWRHDGDGWCAIRPPASSFSWVAAEHLEIAENPGIGRVINVPVKTRVGSRFSDDRDVEYISLRRGEVVELMGTTKELDEVGNEIRWFKIAPPSGEFRWVHESQIARLKKRHDAAPKSLEPVSDTVALAVPPPAEVVVGTSQIRTFDLARKEPRTGADSATAASEKVNAVPSSTTMATHQPRRDSAFVEVGGSTGPLRTVSYNATDREPAATRAAAAGTATAQPQAKANAVDKAKQDSNGPHINAVTWEAVGRPDDVLSAPEPRSFEESYDALNLMLSQAVLGDIQQWELSPVQTQAERLLSIAESLDEQDMANSLLSKVGEFASLQQRTAELAGRPRGDSVESFAGQRSSARELTSHEQRLARSAAIDDRIRQVQAIVDVDSAAIKRPSPLGNVQSEAIMPKGPEMPQITRTVTPAADGSKIRLQGKQSLDNSVFDASGTLVAVKSRRSDIPQFALTDSTGQITRFVSTPNDANLARYVNRRVGILGEVGYLRKFNKPHVVAEQIVFLQK